jgi:hypothetical protein
MLPRTTFLRAAAAIEALSGVDQQTAGGSSGTAALAAVRPDPGRPDPGRPDPGHPDPGLTAIFCTHTFRLPAPHSFMAKSAQTAGKPRSGGNMIREFGYKGEMWRVAAHGIAGREEVFIVRLELDGTEGPEASIDRMTEPNDSNAPLEDIIALLCDRLIGEHSLAVRDPMGPFAWTEGEMAHDVHDGIPA